MLLVQCVTGDQLIHVRRVNGSDGDTGILAPTKLVVHMVRWAGVASALFSVGFFGPAQPWIAFYGHFATLVFMKLQGGQHLGFSFSISDLTRSVVSPSHPSPAPAQDPCSRLRRLTVVRECT